MYIQRKKKTKSGKKEGKGVGEGVSALPASSDVTPFLTSLSIKTRPNLVSLSENPGIGGRWDFGPGPANSPDDVLSASFWWLNPITGKKRAA